MASEQSPGMHRSTPDALRQLLGDSLQVLLNFPVDDARYSDSYLNKAVAAGIAGDSALLEQKLKQFLPQGAGYNVHVDNGHRSREIHRGGTPTLERVSADITLVPEWSVVYTFLDFKVHSTASGTPMRVTAIPVHHGGLLPVGTLVANGDFVLDADGDDVPDQWSANGAATAVRELDGGEWAWKITRSTSGVGGVAATILPADRNTAVQVEAKARGDRSCLQFRYLDKDRAAIEVDGSPTACAATVEPADPLVYETVVATFDVPDDARIRHLQVEVALLDAGTTWFRDVAVRPLATATFEDGTRVDLAPDAATGTLRGTAEAGAGGYATSSDPNELLDVDVAIRHRAKPSDTTRTYRTSSNSLIPLLWDDARSGLDASVFQPVSPQVPVNGTLLVDYDFRPYQASLANAGVTLLDPRVTFRIYAPAPDPAGGTVLVNETFLEIGDLNGRWPYLHPGNSLFGPHFVVASVEGDLTAAGHSLVSGQEARKAFVFQAMLPNGAPALPPVYRIVVESWFYDWS